MAIDGTPGPTERLVVARAAMACGRLWNGHSRLISTRIHRIAPEKGGICINHLSQGLGNPRAALLTACVLAVLGLAVAHTGVAHAASSPPATNLGIWTSAEDSGSYSTVSGQTPDVANYYLDWGNSYPQSFFTPAQSAGATAFLEIEPWIGSQGDDTCSGSGPTMTTIGANGSAIESYAESIGSAIASAGKPVIITFTHEFNVSGQYPWAQGDCEGTTASQWVSAWDAVRNDIDSTADGLAYFMWVPDVFNGAGGTVVDPTPYWPGASNVDMVGVDGYPQSQYGETTFANTFAQTFSIIQGLPGESTIAQPKIFVAETNFSPLDSGSYESIPNMMSDICSNGGDGTLQFVGYSDEPNLTSAQWTELDTAQADDCNSSTSPSAPAVTTSAASGVTATAATLNAAVNPEGAATTYQFQYGTSTTYGSVAPASPASAGSGSSAVSESAGLSGLSASTKYDYRLVATNATGTTDGSNQTFTTPAASSPGSAFTPVGGLIQGTSLTPPVTAHAAGDVILLHVTTEGDAPPTGISGGGATWAQVGTTLRGSVNSGFSAAVYEGTVTAAGTATATVTTSGAPLGRADRRARVQLGPRSDRRPGCAGEPGRFRDLHGAVDHAHGQQRALLVLRVRYRNGLGRVYAGIHLRTRQQRQPVRVRSRQSRAAPRVR